MNPNNSTPRSGTRTGFTLPAVLVVVAALLILVIGLLGIFSIERRTARSYVDLQRADMAARAGLEEFKALLDAEASNDDFLIVQNTPDLKPEEDRNLEAAPYLYLVRGEVASGSLKYTYHPMFATAERSSVQGSSVLEAPEPEDLYGKEPEKIETVPWSNPAYGAWIPVKGKVNGKDRTVARYTYWVEDLQSKLNPKIAGNDKDNGLHKRSTYPFPAPGVSYDEVSKDQKPLEGIALYALEKDMPEKQVANAFTEKVIKARSAMITPNSLLGALDYSAPLKRGDDGLLADKLAASVEKNTSPVIHSYDELPTIPFATAFAPIMMGKPKINLNKLLKDPRTSAINEFAGQIDNALPDFAKLRKGGFPEDYSKTLAANALDYADDDQEPTILAGQYLGIDTQPMLSEIALRIDYAPVVTNGRRIGRFTFTLFGELWNMTNQPDRSKTGPKVITGRARLSYEVAMNIVGVGNMTGNPAFDSPAWLENKAIVPSHNLEKIDGRYFSREVSVSLGPNQYKFYNFASVTYSVDMGPTSMSTGQLFSMSEILSASRGITLKWNGKDVARVPKIVRDAYGVENLKVGTSYNKGKAAIVGGSYGPHGDFVNNLGDPRIAPYILQERLGENAFPENISPNRRNIRASTIYNSDTSASKRLWYGRVMPSEWPDRGHDAPLGSYVIPTDPFDPTATKYNYPLEANSEEYAPQRLSNAGKFYSATELGNIFDPIMWEHRYPDLRNKPGSGKADTTTLIPPLGGPLPMMPPARNVFPDIAVDATKGVRGPAGGDTGGGNTLRIGRYEHPKFDGPPDSAAVGLRASYLLDLFHAGKPFSEKFGEKEGEVVEIDGQINLNTASKDSIRAIAAGMLKQDPQLRKVLKYEQNSGTQYVMRSGMIPLGTPIVKAPADLIADAIILNRPYASMGDLAGIRDLKDRAKGRPVFGNLELYTVADVNWNDSAAEEVFARIHDASTFRSRNFRIWVIGQSLGGTETNPEVLAETRKVYTVFADPGERRSNGQIDETKSKSRVTYENSF